MKRSFLLIPFILISFLLLGQKYIEVEGKILNENTNVPVGFAHVSIQGANIGTMTNTNGNFILKVPLKHSKQDIIVSCLGFDIKQISYDEFKAANSIIEISPKSYSLNEVVVEPLDAKKIVKNAITKIQVNYPIFQEIFDAFYRESLSESEGYFKHAEAVIEIYKENYSKPSKDQVKLIKGRSFDIDSKTELGSFFNIEGGPYYCLEYDVVKNGISFINKKHINKYEYKIENVIKYNNRNTYKIIFKQKDWVQKAFFDGILYIDVESLAFVKVDFQFSAIGIKHASNYFVTRNPQALEITPQFAKFSVEYQYIDDFWRLRNTHSNIVLHVNKDDLNVNEEINLKTDLIITNYQSKTFFKELSEENFFKSDDLLTEKITEYDYQFWEQYNILLPDSDLLSLFKNKDHFAEELWQIDKQIDNYNNQNLSERVYLHTDRDIYFPNDTVWFKAYVLDQYNKYSDHSYSLTVELFDDKENRRSIKKFIIENGKSHGQFILPNDLNMGEYALIAYTGLVKDKDVENHFFKKLFVHSPINKELLLEVELNKEKYESADTIRASIFIKQFDKKLLPNKLLKYSFTYGDSILFADQRKLNKYSRTYVKYLIEKIQPGQKLFLNISIPDEKYEKKIFIPVTDTILDLQFFPESGILVNSIRTNVAFKAVNGQGNPINLKGKILDENNELVTYFESNYEGMGVFPFLADPTKEYQIVLDKPFEHNYFKLPEIQEEGIVVLVNNKDSMHTKVSIMPSAGLENLEYYLVVHNKTGIYTGTKLMSGKKMVEIKKDILPKGIINVTLFSKDNIPLAERLIFNSYELTENIDISTSINNDSIEFLFSELNNFDKGETSVSIINSKLKLNDEAYLNTTNILSYFLISSELNGDIPNLNFYLTDSISNVDYILDLIMLTNGWRKYNWQSVISFEADTTYSNEYHEYVFGYVEDKKKKRISNINVSVANFESFLTLENTSTNEEGTFKLLKNNFDDLYKNTIVCYSKKEPKLKLKLKNDKTLNDSLLQAFNIKTRLNNYFIPSIQKPKQVYSFAGTRLLEEINVVDKLNPIEYKTRYEEQFQNASIIGKEIENIHEGRQYFLDILNEIAPPKKVDPINGSIFYDRVRNRRLPMMPGVLSSPDRASNALPSTGTLIQAIDEQRKGGNGVPVNMKTSLEIGQVENVGALIVVNDVPIGNTYFPVEFLTREQIKSISVLKGPQAFAYYGERANGGTIFIETRNTNVHIEPEFEPSENVLTPRLFDVKKEFYVPKYFPKRESNLKEYTTLYWNPNFDLNHNKISWKLNEEQYLDEKLLIVIEGLNSEGQFVYEYKELHLITD